LEKTDNFVFSMVDKTNEAELRSYERAFYRAFGHMKNLDHLWDFDHKSKRIVTKIPYETQELYVARLGERIVAGCAVNFDHKNPLQLEMEGFAVDKSNKAVAEIIQMFSLLDPMGGTPMLKLFTKYFLEKLVARNVRKVYGTCSERRVRPYQMIGLNVIGDLSYKNEKVYLLEMDLAKLPNLQ